MRQQNKKNKQSVHSARRSSLQNNRQYLDEYSASPQADYQMQFRTQRKTGREGFIGSATSSNNLQNEYNSPDFEDQIMFDPDSENGEDDYVEELQYEPDPDYTPEADYLAHQNQLQAEQARKEKARLEREKRERAERERLRQERERREQERQKRARQEKAQQEKARNERTRRQQAERAAQKAQQRQSQVQARPAKPNYHQRHTQRPQPPARQSFEEPAYTHQPERQASAYPAVFEEEIWYEDEQSMEYPVYMPESNPIFDRLKNLPLPQIQPSIGLLLGTVAIVIMTLSLLVVWQLGAFSGRSAASDSQPFFFRNLNSQVTITYAPTELSPFFSPSVQYWRPQILEWAAEHNLDPNMVATVMQIESCGDPQAQSGAGAIGLFQVMPFHFVDGENPYDPDTNAMRGMNYLAERLVQTGGESGRAFAGYNGGHVAAGSSWDQWPNETQRYYRWSTGIYADAQAGNQTSETLNEWIAAGGGNLCVQAEKRLGIR